MTDQKVNQHLYSGIIEIDNVSSLGGIGISRVAAGEAKAKWTAKGFTSAELAVVTGLNSITAAVATVSGRGELTIGIVSKAGGTATFQVRDNIAELPIGTEVTFYWIAVGE